MTTQHTLTDERFGQIEVAVDGEGGLVEVSGDDIPGARIVRTDSVGIDPSLPIGTREPNFLTMTVDNLGATLEISSVRLARGAVKVIVESLAGGFVLFTPASGSAHRLVRGTAYGGDNEMGRFARSADGRIDARWHDDRSLFGVLPKKSAAQPVDAAVGYVLAAAFGTGGRRLGL